MSGFRIPEEPRDQLVLFPRRLDEAIAADHPARLVLSILESASLSASIQAMERSYSWSRGRPAYHPRYLTTLYVYGLMIGIRSSRRLEDACHNRIDVRFLMENQRPDHTTIANFVTRHEKALEKLFIDTLMVGSRAGLVQLKEVAVDGTTLKAQGSKGSIRSRDWIEKQLEAVSREAARLTAEYKDNEQREAEAESIDWGGDPDESLAKQQERFAKKKATLEKALAEIEERKARSARGASRLQEKASLTDPEARGMRGKDGAYGLHYNAQVAVDVDSGMVVAVGLSDESDDSGQLIPMIHEIENNCGRKPDAVLADSAYGPGPDLEALEEAGIEGFIATPEASNEVDESVLREQLSRVAAGATLEVEEARRMPKGRNGRLDRRCFHYEKKDDVYLCPMGARLAYRRTQTQKQKGRVVKRRVYESDDCSDCPLLTACCGRDKTTRMITRDKYEGTRERLRERMSSERGKAIYRARAPSVEGRIAMMTNITGSRKVRRRGRAKAKLEWYLSALAVNLKILIASWTKVEPVL